MNERTIRKPTGPAVIFLLSALGFISTIFSHSVLAQLLEPIEEMPVLGILQFILLGATNLFMSIILFSKKYNNMLIIGVFSLLIASIVTTDISNMIFCLVLIAFTYIMVKMPETPIREKAVKLRFIIPLLQFILILISAIQSVHGVYEQYTQTAGAYPEGAINAAIVLLPTILVSIISFLPVICYIWLANWMAAPYEKQIEF